MSDSWQCSDRASCAAYSGAPRRPHDRSIAMASPAYHVDLAGARAAYSPRTRDVEHLHESGALRAARHDLSRGDRCERGLRRLRQSLNIERISTRITGCADGAIKPAWHAAIRMRRRSTSSSIARAARNDGRDGACRNYEKRNRFSGGSISDAGIRELDRLHLDDRDGADDERRRSMRYGVALEAARRGGSPRQRLTS